jgi:hypothetical protein
MKNTELRIGNLVEIYGKVEKVVDVMCDCVNTLNIEGAHYGLVNPIPLTEEWLLNFGFIKNSTSWTNWEKPTAVKEVRVSIHNKYLFYNGRMIKFIHQLQNLYFALTGEELTTKK